jgi:hypothetical protein
MRKWLSERFNRKQFGKPDLVAAIGIQIDAEFLGSLKQVEVMAQERDKKARLLKAEVEAKDAGEVEEAEFEVVEE